MCLRTYIFILLALIGFATSAPLDLNATSGLRIVNAGEEGDFLEGDIITLQPDTLRNLVRQPHQLWPNKLFLYKFGEEFTELQRFNIETALRDLAAQTCVQFKERTNEKNYVVFRNYGGICASAVGYTDFGVEGGSVPIYVSAPGCEMRGQIQHEVLHSLGFWHEHARPDRDYYVIVHWEHIKPGFQSNFDAKTWADTQTLGLPYDTGSVMHYRSTAFSNDGSETLEARMPQKKGTFAMGQRFRISNLDIAKLNRLYSCDDRYYKGNDVAASVS